MTVSSWHRQRVYYSGDILLCVDSRIVGGPALTDGGPTLTDPKERKPQILEEVLGSAAS